MYVAMTYLHTPFLELLIEQLEQVKKYLVKRDFNFENNRFVKVLNGMHDEQRWNFFKI